MRKLAPTKVDTSLKAILECEKRANLYNQLYELLAGFDNEIAIKDEVQLNKELEDGEIKSLSALGKRFDELADYEYRKANLLLKDIKNSL